MHKYISTTVWSSCNIIYVISYRYQIVELLCSLLVKFLELPVNYRCVWQMCARYRGSFDGDKNAGRAYSKTHSQELLVRGLKVYTFHFCLETAAPTFPNTSPLKTLSRPAVRSDSLHRRPAAKMSGMYSTYRPLRPSTLELDHLTSQTMSRTFAQNVHNFNILEWHFCSI